ncbi:hypothetical protein QBC34DRAFT_437852 [Podospora aff. communis PSN243]|uniref:Mid2 domain-containing protein n=1 Tax=Podospora aff. communis PSN243 TaxID=3040156 RepID=A0AAV9GP80_9PEZI|nr:hypothetical protein QBC34DRAFT_437852 [Podospora aff. communis PSN243]
MPAPRQLELDSENSFQIPEFHGNYSMGENLEIQWTTTFPSLNIRLWQKVLNNDEWFNKRGGTIVVVPETNLQLQHMSYKWNVQTYNLDTLYSGIFFLWAFNGTDPAAQKSGWGSDVLRKTSFRSYEFVINQAKSSGTPSPSARQTNTSSIAATSTSTATAAALAKSSGDHEVGNGNQAYVYTLALGLGIAFGVLLLAVIAGGFVWYWKRRQEKGQVSAASTTGGRDPSADVPAAEAEGVGAELCSDAKETSTIVVRESKPVEMEGAEMEPADLA